MTQHPFFIAVSDQSPFRQGDVIRWDASPSNAETFSKPEWGVIITADCDIAQRKMGEFFTYLVIRSARDYVQDVWATEELSKLSERYGRMAIEQIHQADRLRDANANPLTLPELIDWVQTDGVDKILDAVKITETSARMRLSAAIEIAATTDGSIGEYLTPLDRLKACWTRAGRKDADQRGLIQNSLLQRNMRAEYMLVPTLPSETDVGFVVMLRDIRAIRSTDLFPSRLDLRIGNSNPTAMHRIGRFNDFIRYAIAQRMANLFSRIGMTDQFESDCEVAANLTLEPLVTASNKNET